MKVVFTGSSVLDKLKGSADLSCRSIIHKLQGLSFREYLEFFHNCETGVYSSKQIVNNEVKLENIQHPLPLFNDYLQRGYYPYGVIIEQDSKSFVVKDDIEYGYLNVVPLWAFGLNY